MTTDNPSNNGATHTDAIRLRSVRPDASKPNDVLTDLRDQRTAVARSIGEGLRLAGAIEALGIERVVTGTEAEFDLAIRLHNLTDQLGHFADEGDGAAAVVHGYLFPIIARLEAAALADACDRVGTMTGRDAPHGNVRPTDAPPANAIASNVIAFPHRTPEACNPSAHGDEGDVR